MCFQPYVISEYVSELVSRVVVVAVVVVVVVVVVVGGGGGGLS